MAVTVITHASVMILQHTQQPGRVDNEAILS